MNALEQGLAQILNGGDITVSCNDLAVVNDFCEKYNRKYGIRVTTFDQVAGTVRIQKHDATPVEGFNPAPAPEPTSFETKEKSFF
jgi:hypothetical protein